MATIQKPRGVHLTKNEESIPPKTSTAPIRSIDTNASTKGMRFESKMQSMSKIITPSKEKLESLRKNISPSKERMETLRKSVSPSKERIETLRKSMSPSKEQMELLRKNVSPSKERMEMLRKNISPSKERLESLRKNVSPSKERMETLRKSISPSKERIDSLRNSVSSTKERLGSSSRRIISNQKDSLKGNGQHNSQSPKQRIVSPRNSVAPTTQQRGGEPPKVPRKESGGNNTAQSSRFESIVSRKPGNKKSINGSESDYSNDSSSVQQKSSKSSKQRMVLALKSARNSVAPAAQNLGSSLRNVKRSPRRVQLNTSATEKADADSKSTRNSMMRISGKGLLKGAGGMLSRKSKKSKNNDVLSDDLGKLELKEKGGDKDSYYLDYLDHQTGASSTKDKRKKKYKESSRKAELTQGSNVVLATVLSATQISMKNSIINGKEEYIPSGNMKSTHTIIDDSHRKNGKKSKKRSQYESADGEWRAVVSITHNKQPSSFSSPAPDTHKSAVLMKHEEISSKPLVLLSRSKDSDSRVESQTASAAIWLDPDDKVDVERSKDISDKSIKHNKMLLLGVPGREQLDAENQPRTPLLSMGSLRSLTSNKSAEVDSPATDNEQDGDDELYTITLSLHREYQTSIEKNFLPNSKRRSAKKSQSKKKSQTAEEESFEIEDVYKKVIYDAIQKDVIEIGSTSFFVSHRYTNDNDREDAMKNNSSRSNSKNNRPLFEALITTFVQSDGATADGKKIKQWTLRNPDTRAQSCKKKSIFFPSKAQLTLPLFGPEIPIEQVHNQLRKAVSNTRLADHDGKINFNNSQQTNKALKLPFPASKDVVPSVAIRVSLLEMLGEIHNLGKVSVKGKDDSITETNRQNGARSGDAVRTQYKNKLMELSSSIMQSPSTNDAMHDVDSKSLQSKEGTSSRATVKCSNTSSKLGDESFNSMSEVAIKHSNATKLLLQKGSSLDKGDGSAGAPDAEQSLLLSDEEGLSSDVNRSNKKPSFSLWGASLFGNCSQAKNSSMLLDKIDDPDDFSVAGQHITVASIKNSQEENLSRWADNLCVPLDNRKVNYGVDDDNKTVNSLLSKHSKKTCDTSSDIPGAHDTASVNAKSILTDLREAEANDDESMFTRTPFNIGNQLAQTSEPMLCSMMDCDDPDVYQQQRMLTFDEEHRLSGNRTRSLMDGEDDETFDENGTYYTRYTKGSYDSDGDTFTLNGFTYQSNAGDTYTCYEETDDDSDDETDSNDETDSDASSNTFSDDDTFRSDDGTFVSRDSSYYPRRKKR